MALSTVSKSSRVIRTEALTFFDLKSLIDGKVLAISVQRFAHPEICKEVAKKATKNPYEYYTYAKDVVGRYGMSFSEIGTSQEMFRQYYERAIPSINTIRDQFFPYLSPVDKLRLTLDEIWPKGAKIEQLHPGHKMFVGLLRVIDPNKEVLPHQDMVSWDAHECAEADLLIKQLAVNIYLQVPNNGGELELWEHGIANKEEYLHLAEGTYGIKKEHLPPPVEELKPSVGEIIIFNPRKFHCIRPGDSLRLTMSCFLGFRGMNNPITFFS